MTPSATRTTLLLLLWALAVALGIILGQLGTLSTPSAAQGQGGVLRVLGSLSLDGTFPLHLDLVTSGGGQFATCALIIHNPQSAASVPAVTQIACQP